ncbi:MAG: adenylate/guanylate cyclase domain-containing protein [Treponema sp.]|nr:adenylate/guanylate cyclase domain-containing protein [Treponema sp.]
MLCTGFCVSLIPVESIVLLIIVHLFQSIALVSFELFLFYTLYLSSHEEKIKGDLFVPLGITGFLMIPLPMAVNVPSAYFLGAWSFALSVLILVMACIERKNGRETGAYLAGGGEIFLMALSFLTPLPGLRILFWALPAVFFLVRGERLFPLFLKASRNSAAAPAVNTGKITAEYIGKMAADAAPRTGAGMEFVAAAEAVADAESSMDDEDIPVLKEISEGVPEKVDLEYRPNPFIPREFLKILNKKTVMDLRLGDHVQQEMTIFFSDIRQFTDLSSRLTPEEIFKFINSYLARVVPVIGANGGFVDKYIGDAILALYSQVNGADMAVRSAIEIQQRLLEYNNHRAKMGYRPLQMGIGIHTGPLMIGVVGIYGRMQNTVISDTVNLASRIETMTKAFNVSMAISGQTFKKLADPGSYKYRYLGPVKVRGDARPVEVFEILDGINPETMAKKMETNRFFEEGMICFRHKSYSEAQEKFARVLEILPDDGASMFYMENCEARLRAAEKSPLQV